jgi:DNA-binding transcriptional LysR family regulator
VDRVLAIRTFITVVAEGSFSKAALSLNISPQLASKYVSQLEQTLGVRLLNRTTRTLHTTEAGLTYFKGTQHLLDELDQLEHQLGDMHTQAQGTLRIAAPVSFAMHHLGKPMAEFQQQHPGIKLDLQLNDRKVDILEEGFDIALRIGHLKSSSFIAKRLAPVRLILCASPGYLNKRGRPTQPDDLKYHDILNYSYMDLELNHPFLKAIKRSDTHSSQAFKFNSNNGDILTQAAIADAGILFQPSFIVSTAIANGQLEPLFPEQEPAPMALYALYAHRQYLTSKVRSLIDFMDGYFDEVPYWDKALEPLGSLLERKED